MRWTSRITVAAGAAFERMRRPHRAPPTRVQRVLIVHDLGLAQTLMLTPLLAKLRHNHPGAHIAMTVRPEYSALYASRPYGVVTLPCDPVQPLLAERGGYDLAIVPDDPSLARVALACGARWNVAFEAGGAVDEVRAYPDQPTGWGDAVAGLADGLAPPPYRRSDWPDPFCLPFDPPAERPYAVLHVGADALLEAWPTGRWQALAAELARDFAIVVLAPARSVQLVDAIDPQRHYRSYRDGLDPAQTWRLIGGAALLVTAEGALAHLGRLTATPTVALFGPSTPVLTGAGSFWRTSAYRAVTYPDFPCRDQQALAGHEIEWLRRCTRTEAGCAGAKCMQLIAPAEVRRAIEQLVPEGAAG